MIVIIIQVMDLHTDDNNRFHPNFNIIISSLTVSSLFHKGHVLLLY